MKEKRLLLALMLLTLSAGSAIAADIYSLTWVRPSGVGFTDVATRSTIRIYVTVQAMTKPTAPGQPVSQRDALVAPSKSQEGLLLLIRGVRKGDEIRDAAVIGVIKQPDETQMLKPR